MPGFCIMDNAVSKVLGSSSGLGHRPLTAGTGVRLPYRVPGNDSVIETTKNLQKFWRFSRFGAILASPEWRMFGLWMCSRRQFELA